MSVAVSLRRKVSMLMLPPLLAITAFLLWRAESDIPQIGLLLAFLLLYWWADMRTQLLDQVLFFDRKTTRIQMMDTGIALLRLGMVSLARVSGTLSAALAVLFAVFQAVGRVPLIGLWVGRRVGTPAERAPQEYVDELQRAVRRQLPMSVFFVFQSQVVLVVLSLAANQSDLAGFGALNRIVQLMAPIQAFTFAFAVPVFASATSSINLKFAQLVLVCATPGAALITVAVLAPSLVLLLVGPNYADLQTEIVLAAGMAMAQRVSGSARSLVSNRGWLKWNWLPVPLSIGWVAVAPFVLDLGTIAGALLLQTGLAVGTFISAIADLIDGQRNRG